MGKVYLFVDVFATGDKVRDAELRTCLQRNLENNALDEIHCIVDPKGEDIYREFAAVNEKLHRIESEARPTYRDYFEAICRVQAEHAESLETNLYILSNADIIFDERDLRRSQELSLPYVNQCWALLRWEIEDIDKITESKLLSYDLSQDVWMFRGQFDRKFFERPEAGNFYLGKPGCDNLIATHLTGYYTVLNPALSFHTYHYHVSPLRTYTQSERLFGKYTQLPVIRIKDF